MPTPEELQSALDDLWGSVNAAKTRINEDVDALEARINELSNNAPETFSSEQLQPVLQKILDLRNNINSIDPVPPPEEPAP